MSVHGKDQGNHVFDVGVDVRPWERPKEPCLRRAGRCPPMGRTQGTMSSTWEGIDVRPREGPREPHLRRGGSMSAHGKGPGNHVFEVGGDRCPSMGRTKGTVSSTWEGIDVRPREGPREPCLRRGRSMSANWKDPGNHIFDVGVDVRPWERPKEPSSTCGSMSAHGKDSGNHVFDVGVHIRPWEGPREPCFRRGGPYPPMRRGC